MKEVIDSVSSVEASASIDKVLQSARQSFDSPAMDNLSQKFQSMMQASPTGAPPVAFPTNPGPNAVTDLVNKHQEFTVKTNEELRNLAEEAKYLTPHELDVRSMVLMHNMAMQSFQSSAIMGVAQGTNKSLQSLLKNQ